MNVGEGALSFYSTYEELKPRKERKHIWWRKGFYSTYEELKHPVYVVYNHMFSCFYSTYEELKPQSGIDKNAFSTEFLQYLWGIETYLLWYKRFFF